MSDHVYKKIELVGSSPKSIEAAVENALARAKKTIRNMRWLEVTETRGHIEDGKIDHWQVAVKVGFTLDDQMCRPVILRRRGLADETPLSRSDSAVRSERVPRSLLPARPRRLWSRRKAAAPA